MISAHITRKAIEIEVSAPFASRAMISLSEYFCFPEPNTPSTSLRLHRSALASEGRRVIAGCQHWRLDRQSCPLLPLMP